MKRACLLTLVALSLTACPFGSKDPPSPRTRTQFCLDWATAACNAKVVSVCQAADADACRMSQQSFCLSIVPTSFSDQRGAVCIAAVKAAYADADLDAAELVTVRSLGVPCDQLVVGPKGRGVTCAKHDDCDTAAGFDCVYKASAAGGTCQMPEDVSPGEVCAAAQQVCTSGFFCDGKHCVAALDVGEACASQEECGDKGFCAGSNVCAARFAVDHACSDDGQCLAGICYDFATDQVCSDRIVLSRSEPICDDLR